MPNDAELAVAVPQAPPSTDEAPERPTPTQLRALWLPFILFTLISIADTVSSVVMLGNGMMEEANPAMRWVWEAGGAAGFAMVKALLVLVPLAIFNALKVRRYWFIRRVIWITILGYVLIYGVFFYLGNY
jgi:hypothetical protein